MRKSLSAAVAAVVLGLGVSSVMASSSPIQAVIDAAPLLASQTGVGAGHPTDGAELAGLANAASLGVTGLSSAMGTQSRAILSYVGSLGSPDTNKLTGDEAYGLIKAAQQGATFTTINYGGGTFTDGLSAAQYYYTTVIPTTDHPTALGTALNVVSPTDLATNPDTYGLYHLSYHVLATTALGAGYGGGITGVWAQTLLGSLGNLDTTASDALNEGSGDVGTVEALAISLWALKTAGYADSTLVTGTGTFGGVNTLDTLRLLLKSEITSDTFYQRLNHAGGTGSDYAAGYAEDLAYGILALEAFNNPADTATIESLQLKLAQAVGATGTTGEVPLDVVTFGPGSGNPQYAGAALQALPEPATLSLLGLGGMALLARRRRNA